VALNRAIRVTTADKVDFLSCPESYPGLTGRVTVEETHMSWVFLLETRVYKLKKPVRYPFLDFTTLAAREGNCRKEVQLNRRLAPEVYLGVVALTVDEDGVLAVDGHGQVVDWMVEMRRLPADRMLDRAIAEGTVSPDEVTAVARRLSTFYHGAAAADIGAADYVDQFAHEQAINRDVLTHPDFDLDRSCVDSALRRVEDMISHRPQLLHQRVEAGRIVEGHGDLRPEHVCLVDPPAIIDCLEFSRRLRLIDPMDELVFLALECRRLEAGWIGERIHALCAETLQDKPAPELIAFYWTYRALLRARLSLVHLLEGDTRKPNKWLPQARRYVELAASPPL
jgi:uncharacterized protein